MMIKLKNEGFVQDNETIDSNDNQKSSKLTIEEVVAQGFNAFLMTAFLSMFIFQLLCFS